MRRLLVSKPLTDEQRKANDKHHPAVVIAVLCVLSIYIYLFTHAADVFDIPRPKDLAKNLGIKLDHVFDSDKNVNSTVVISLTQQFENNDDERLVLFVFIVLAFLFSYFLPVRFKPLSLVLVALACIVLLYGYSATSGLLATHGTLYLILHPHRKYNVLVSGLFGILVYFAFVYDEDSRLSIAYALIFALCSIAIYKLFIERLLEFPRCAATLRTTAVQSAILTVSIGTLIEGFSGEEWKLPLGVLLFFWQWERIIMYYVDYKDGRVPNDISIFQYLAVFLNPGVIPNWTWGVTIGQGYT